VSAGESSTRVLMGWVRAGLNESGHPGKRLYGIERLGV
jgi:hypothetical protein